MKRLLFLTILSVLVMSTTYGRMISGVVSDGRDGAPLIGAAVKNGSRGAVVDFDGSYRIEAETGDELSYSYVGYSTVVKTVGSESIINVELKVSTGDEILDAMVDGMYEMKEPLEECVRAIRSMIDRTPPDVRRGIEAKGIYLTGGIANLRGLSTYLEESIGLPVTTVPDPELCAVKGLQKIILSKAYYKKLTYSMLDEDYRWLR